MNMTVETATATRLRWSTLKHLATSAKLLKWRMEKPQEETPALILGRAIHCRVLEPEEFPKRWVVAGKCAGIVKSTGAACGSQGSLHLDGSWYCKVKGHAPAGAGALPAGIEVIEEKNLELVHACANAVQEHTVSSVILKHGLPEEG